MNTKFDFIRTLPWLPSRLGSCRPVLILPSSLAMAACVSTPAPGAQLLASKWAVDSASAVGGDDAAAGEMRLARDKLARANAALATKDYDRARWLGQEAEVDAQLAGVKALAGGESETRVELQDANRGLPEEAEANPKLLHQARSDFDLRRETRKPTNGLKLNCSGPSTR